MPVAGVEVKLRAWYRLGVQPGVRGRDGGIGVPWWIDAGTVMEASSKPQGRVSTRRSWATPALPRRNASV